MKSFIALAMAVAVLASPIQVQVQKRQYTSLTENEFTTGGCRDVIFLWARGSTEAGNMVSDHEDFPLTSWLIPLKGSIIGVPLSDGLKGALGDSTVATEGVDYAALLSTNLLPGGADPAGIAEMVELFNQAATQCPDSKIVAGGYRYVSISMFCST